MTRILARGLEGERVYFKRPGSRGSNISLVGAIRLKQKPVLYPFDGAVDGDRFLKFLDEHLLPTLGRGDVLILDNCRIHHIKEVAERLAAVGARALYLPPYSPELNPIEEAWSLMKATFRSLQARTIAAYVDAIDVIRNVVTPEKIEGYFKHANTLLVNGDA